MYQRSNNESLIHTKNEDLESGDAKDRCAVLGLTCVAVVAGDDVCDDMILPG